jgi:hypothetical protein
MHLLRPLVASVKVVNRTQVHLSQITRPECCTRDSAPDGPTPRLDQQQFFCSRLNRTTCATSHPAQSPRIPAKSRSRRSSPAQPVALSLIIMRPALRTASRLLEPALRQSVLLPTSRLTLQRPSLPVSLASASSRTFATPTTVPANDPSKRWWAETPASQQVYVRNLPKDMDEAKLKAFLETKVGGRAPTKIRVMSASNRSRYVFPV